MSMTDSVFSLEHEESLSFSDPSCLGLESVRSDRQLNVKMRRPSDDDTARNHGKFPHLETDIVTWIWKWEEHFSFCC